MSTDLFQTIGLQGDVPELELCITQFYKNDVEGCSLSVGIRVWDAPLLSRNIHLSRHQAKRLRDAINGYLEFTA